MKRILSLALVLVMLLSQFSLTAMANGETMKTTGTWKFTPWDKENFQITADTEITGSWKFTPTFDPDKYPRTGDNNRPTVWLTMMAISVATAVKNFPKKKRKIES